MPTMQQSGALEIRGQFGNLVHVTLQREKGKFEGSNSRVFRWASTIMKTSSIPHSCHLSGFLCSHLHLFPTVTHFPPLPSSTSSHNHPHATSTRIPPHTFDFHASSCCAPLSSLLPCPGPPPIPPCRIITTSPWGPTSAPCTFPTRVREEATTASSRRRRCLLTGPGPSTSTSTSRTGSPPPSSPARTARTPRLLLDPDSLSGDDAIRSVGYECGRLPVCRTPGLVDARGSNRTERAAVRPRPVSSLAEWDHCISSTKAQQWYRSVTIIGWISWTPAQVCVFTLCRAALIRERAHDETTHHCNNWRRTDPNSTQIDWGHVVCIVVGF